MALIIFLSRFLCLEMKLITRHTIVSYKLICPEYYKSAKKVIPTNCNKSDAFTADILMSIYCIASHSERVNFYNYFYTHCYYKYV